MLTVAALIIASKTILPDIAFSARYYKPGKEKSYYHLYLCKFDGSKKRTLVSGKRSQLTPIWIDKVHLAYSEMDGTPSSVTGDQSISIRVSIKVLNLTTGKIRTLAETIEKDSWPKRGDKPNTIVTGGSMFTFSKTGFTKRKYVWLDNWKEYGDFDARSGTWKATIAASKVSPEWKINFVTPKYAPSYQDNEAKFEDLTVTAISKNVQGTFCLKGEIVESVAPVGLSKLSVVTALANNRFDNFHYVYELDCKAKTSKLLVSDIGAIDYKSKEGYWLGYQTDSRVLSALDGVGQVWVNSLYSGEVASGRRWTISTGRVLLSDYATRPLK